METFIGLIAILLNISVKLLVGWCAYLIAHYLSLPDWGVIVLIIMAVQSSGFTYEVHNG